MIVIKNITKIFTLLKRADNYQDKIDVLLNYTSEIKNIKADIRMFVLGEVFGVKLYFGINDGNKKIEENFK